MASNSKSLTTSDDGENKRRLKSSPTISTHTFEGDAHTLTLAGELHSYQEATNVLKGTGKTLIQAAHEYADAIRALNGVPLAIAVRVQAGVRQDAEANGHGSR